MKKTLLGLTTIGIVFALVLGLSGAFFSDTETSTGNILQAGELDLLLNDGNNTPALVNLTDLKPGDFEIVNKRLRVQNPAWVWLHLIDFETSQGTQTEPEDLEEDGTPKYDLENYL